MFYKAIKRQRIAQLEVAEAMNVDNPTYLPLSGREQGWLERARDQLVSFKTDEEISREEAEAASSRGRRTSQQERELRQREQVNEKEDREKKMRSSIAKNGDERRQKLRPQRRVRFASPPTEEEKKQKKENIGDGPGRSQPGEDDSTAAPAEATPKAADEQPHPSDRETATLLREAVERAITRNGKKRAASVSDPVDATQLSAQESSYIVADEAERLHLRLHWIQLHAAEMNNGSVSAVSAKYGPDCIEAYAVRLAELEMLALRDWASRSQRFFQETGRAQAAEHEASEPEVPTQQSPSDVPLAATPTDEDPLIDGADQLSWPDAEQSFETLLYEHEEHKEREQVALAYTNPVEARYYNLVRFESSDPGTLQEIDRRFPWRKGGKS